MKTRPEMTDEEIRSYMDFDQLLEMNKTTSVRTHFPKGKYSLMVALVAGLGIFGWVWISGDNEVDSNPFLNPPMTNESIQKKIEKPATDSVPDNSSSKKLSEESRIVRKHESKASTEKSALPALSEKSSDRNPMPADQPEEKPAITGVYVQAEPVKGYPDLYEYFNRELKYPQQALKDSVQGEVIAVFTINPKGVPENISIEHSLGSLFDQEVVRLISNMPVWKPATYNDKPVASKLSLPLTFQIKKIPSQK